MNEVLKCACCGQPLASYVETTELSTRTKNLLKRKGVRSADDLRALSEDTFLRYHGAGPKMWREIADLLQYSPN
jgi:DNA-directed RNA polymerase alpha subunit